MLVHRSLAVILALTSFVGVIAACSSEEPASRRAAKGDDDDDDDDDDSTDGGKSSSGGDPAKTAVYATELCARIDRCAPGRVAADWGDAKTCAANFQKDVEPLRKAPSSGVTDAALTACTAKLKTESCDKFDDEIPECQFKGKLAPASPCAIDEQCDTGLCFYASDTECGKCTARAAEGGDCKASDCVPGLYCNAQDKCAKPLAAGGDCRTGPCGAGLRCIGGTCAAAVAKDATCTEPTGEQDDDPCVAGAFCIQGTCKALPATAKPGEACGPTVGCAGGYCGEGDKCVALGKEGASCEEYFDCQSPMGCVDKKCAFDNEVSTCK